MIEAVKNTIFSINIISILFWIGILYIIGKIVYNIITKKRLDG